MTRTPPDQPAPARYRRWMIGFWFGWAVLAIGEVALGGLVIGRHASAANGVALGYDEARGRQTECPLG